MWAEILGEILLTAFRKHWGKFGADILVEILDTILVQNLGGKFGRENERKF